MSKIDFYAITYEQYTGITTKDSNALYFLTDKNEIYKGTVRYSHPAKFVTAYPESGQQTGTIYVNTVTNDAKIWNGEAWKSFYTLPIENTASNFDTSSANESKVPSVAAVVNYVSGITAGSADAIKTIVRKSGSGNEHLITVTTVGNSSSDLDLLSGFLNGVTFVDGTAEADSGHYGLKFTATGSNASAIYIDIDREKFLSSAAYNSTTHILTLTMSNNDTVTVNLEDLIDTYTAKEVASSDTVQVSIDSSGVISAVARISESAGNKISVNADGMFVGQDSIGSGKDNHILIADANGGISDSNATITASSSISSSGASSSVVVTEEAVVGYVDSALTWITSVSSAAS